MFSAARILAIRKSKGLSQEVLAEQSGVSLRTIQRVEQGDTVPRGYTLQALAAALEVPLEAFRPEPAAAPVAEPAAPLPTSATPNTHSDPQFLQLLNLSALSFLVLPLLNLVVPWLLWRKHRHEVEHAAEVGRRVLGFQILWQVGCFLAYLLAGLVQVVAHTYQVTLPGLYVGIFIGSYLLNLGVVLYYGWQLRRGRLAIYRFRL
ncbi:helix-turn-helix domain-containing protein [Hymenobacter perfusus]|uniref:XRE family transcriptional regulator n=1 Tax=Hymenobacter perfusus TaxID=1236770 RepID=A0A428KJK1_9BACT|nr:helix-turn-helix transcriptional regulator [Hymenobacter perfusus]RSK46612.1 XRE family transcriptional regulator [Hymenobacter perfusus]